MTQRTELLSVSYHHDTDTGMYRVGEIDFGIRGTLEEYIKRYGYEGVKELLATLGHLSWHIKDVFFKQRDQDDRGSCEAMAHPTVSP